ncbi:hypothetical protein ES332_D13G076900v1 [Gossypium tomentosum]|uniref:Uncharacterized protein n=1 Tax=Gossypium tomentosum TaxID=34277 RepID=A0A5D2HUM1_GOSTO|nr:hypothetical protein ES332_D13G076900v1 [Gossypium tomentosum]
MAMGGLLISQKGNGNGQQRPRPCGLVLLLAFGVAMLAIMALHKLRERRISNLLQENSHHLISLQLLLQKQTEYTKQLKGKAEETKAKMNSLRKQKMELDHRLLEMLSTIDSLKDEQKTMESELVDKQNQIKLLRHSGNQNPQLPALIATLKQKEDEIQDLKHRLNSSLTTHHPANPPNKYNNYGAKDSVDTCPYPHHQEDNREWVKNGDEKKGETTLENDMNSKHTTTDMEKNHAKATATFEHMDEGKNKSSPQQEGELHKSQPSHQGRNKLETDDSKISSLAERFGNLSTTKGMIFAKKRFLENVGKCLKKVNSEIDGVESTSRIFSTEYQDVRSMEEWGKPETGLRKEMDLATANLLRRHNSEAMSTNQDNSEARKVSENTGVNGEASNNTNEVNQQNFEATNDNSRDVEEQEKEVAERDEMEDMEISDKQAATNGDLSGDFMSDSQDKQGYKEEMNES